MARAAPPSEGCSLEEPALGKVRVTVLEREASSVTTVRPDGSVVTEEELDCLGAGEVAGILFFKLWGEIGGRWR